MTAPAKLCPVCGREQMSGAEVLEAMLAATPDAPFRPSRVCFSGGIVQDEACAPPEGWRARCDALTANYEELLRACRSDFSTLTVDRDALLAKMRGLREWLAADTEKNWHPISPPYRLLIDHLDAIGWPR